MKGRIEPGDLCRVTAPEYTTVAVVADTVGWQSVALVKDDDLVMVIAMQQIDRFFATYAYIVCPDSTLGWLPVRMLVRA